MTILLFTILLVLAVMGILVFIVLVVPKPPTLEPIQSFLAPVMAADALDGDLRVFYAQSLVLDAKWTEEFGSEDPPKLGAELRRLILEVQAARMASGKTPEGVLELLKEWTSLTSVDGISPSPPSISDIQSCRRGIAESSIRKDRSFQH